MKLVRIKTSVLSILLILIGSALGEGWRKYGKKYQDMGLGFQETMKGFASTGDIPYSEGFRKGKQDGNSIQFSLNVSIHSMEKFLQDDNHSAQVSGNIEIHSLSSSSSFQLDSQADLRIFDNGIQNRSLTMHYFLPFSANGKSYSLEGVKYIRGSDCINLLQESTTLYVHLREGSTRNEGKIVSSGIVTIDDLDIISLLASLHFVGSGNDADKLNTLVEFAEFLLGDVWNDCVSFKNWKTSFWYIWASDGNNGFLLDLIERPTELELRLEVYENTSKPLVIKEFLDLSKFSQDSDTIRMGPLTLSHDQCKGTVQNVSIDVSFTLSNRSCQFVPNWIENTMDDLLPDVISRYGRLSAGKVNNVAYARNTPLVYTTYPIQIGLGWFKWSMISAMEFVGSDLQVEVVAMNLEGLWLSSVYLYYEGKEHLLNEPLLLESDMSKHGEVENGRRVFQINIHTLFISGSITCSAPLDQFALLEREGNTQIHTTVFGECSAVIHGKKLHSRPTALLEIKSEIQD